METVKQRTENTSLNKNNRDQAISPNGRSGSEAYALSRGHQTELLRKASDSPHQELKKSAQRAISSKRNKTMPPRSKSLSFGRKDSNDEALDLPKTTRELEHEQAQRPIPSTQTPFTGSTIDGFALPVAAKTIVNSQNTITQEPQNSPTPLNLSRNTTPNVSQENTSSDTKDTIPALNLKRAEAGLRHELKCIASILPIAGQESKGGVVILASQEPPKVITSFIDKLGKHGYATQRVGFAQKITDRMKGIFALNAPNKREQYRINFAKGTRVWLTPCIELENNKDENEKNELRTEYKNHITTLIEKGVKISILLTERSSIFHTPEQLETFEKDQIKKWLNYYLQLFPKDKQNPKKIHSAIEFCFVGEWNEQVEFEFSEEQVTCNWEKSSAFNQATIVDNQLFDTSNEDCEALEMTLLSSATEYVKRKLKSHQVEQKTNGQTGLPLSEQKKPSSKNNSPMLASNSNMPVIPEALYISTNPPSPKSASNSPKDVSPTLPKKNSPPASETDFKRSPYADDDYKRRTAVDLMSAVAERMAPTIEKNAQDRNKLSGFAFFVSELGNNWVSSATSTPNSEQKTDSLDPQTSQQAVQSGLGKIKTSGSNENLAMSHVPPNRSNSSNNKELTGSASAGYRANSMFSDDKQNGKPTHPTTQNNSTTANISPPI